MTQYQVEAKPATLTALKAAQVGSVVNVRYGLKPGSPERFRPEHEASLTITEVRVDRKGSKPTYHLTGTNAHQQFHITVYSRYGFINLETL